MGKIYSMKRKEDHYRSLGIDNDATGDEIRSAWRRRVKDCHPDASGGDHTAEEFRAAREAYEVLSDPERRADYDRSRTGSAGTKGFGFEEGFDYEDLFSARDTGFSGGGFHYATAAADIELVLSPAEAARGGRFALRSGAGCSFCSSFGSFFEDICPFCGGSGEEGLYLDLPPGTGDGTLYELEDTYTGETTIVLVRVGRY